MKKLKILYFSNAFIAGHGGRLHSEAFLKEATEHPAVEVIHTFPKPRPSKPVIKSKRENFRKKIKKNPYLQILFFYRRNLQSYKVIIPIIESLQPNILHIRLDSNFLIIEKLKKKFPSLVITTEVNASPFDENFDNIAIKSYFEKLEEKSITQAHANFFVSGFLRDRIVKTSVPARDYIVHNGVEEDFFKLNTKSSTNEKIVFGYIGTIDYHKNLDKLIDAFEEVLHQSDKKIELVIVGDGPLFIELKEYVSHNNLLNEVRFTGWVKHSEIPGYLQTIDIAIHHSAKPYMSPLKLFEYMAAGKAVIGPDIPAVREIFSKNELALVKADLSNLSTEMLKVLNDDNYRKRLSENSQKIVKEKFKWSDNADKIIAIMQKKLNENN